MCFVVGANRPSGGSPERRSECRSRLPKFVQGTARRSSERRLSERGVPHSPNPSHCPWGPVGGSSQTRSIKTVIRARARFRKGLLICGTASTSHRRRPYKSVAARTHANRGGSFNSWHGFHRRAVAPLQSATTDTVTVCNK